MHTDAIDTDILIVGAGPVGLFLANECARRGLQWRLIEASSSQSEYSKALAIFPRTLEILDMAGVVAPFLETANRVTSVAVMAHSRTLARMRFAPENSPYSFIAMVPQNDTERLLVQELGHKDGNVEYGTTFVSADQQNDCVNAKVDVKGTAATVRASFVVGCERAYVFVLQWTAQSGKADVLGWQWVVGVREKIGEGPLPVAGSKRRSEQSAVEPRRTGAVTGWDRSAAGGTAALVPAGSS